MILTTTPRSSFYQQSRYLPTQQSLSDLQLDSQSFTTAKIEGLNQLGDIDLDINFDLDLDDIRGMSSNASSPTSTQSLLSQLQGIQSSSLGTLDTIPTIAVPRGVNQRSMFRAPGDPGRPPNLTNIAPGYSANVDPMQVEPWLQNGQLTPKSAGRAYSLSPGSAGPASPYSQNTSNPQIAVTDTVPDGLPNLTGSEDYYQIAKSFPAAQDKTFYANYPNYTYHAAAAAAAAAKPRVGTTKSCPLSVASSIASDSSPATPVGESEDDSRRQRIGEHFGSTESSDHLIPARNNYSPSSYYTAYNVPKLDRTMTDVYNDELYSPNFTVGATASGQMPVSPNNDLFVQRLQAANSQHLNAQSPISIVSRGRSPFRNGSPLAPTPSHDFSGVVVPSQASFNTEKPIREQRNAMQDNQAMQSQFAKSTGPATPQTISPKDAILDYHEAEGEANFPLFPPNETSAFDANELSKAAAQLQQTFGTSALDGASFGDFVTPQLHTAFQIPQQYPFVADASHHNSSTPNSNPSTGPSRLGSSDIHSDSTHASSPMRPSMTNADGGTYTCTYHGCSLRFETPTLLQKHKREGHRQAHGISAATRRVESPSSGMTSSFLNTQAGPHRCDRINPSTGKPCNTIFSRPYDLTRHEDTIHNARKQKVRCDLCTDEKTFSRADALTRHYRVVHPDIEFQGKHRRRAVHGT